MTRRYSGRDWSPNRPHPAFAGWAIVAVAGWAHLLSGPAQTWAVGIFTDEIIGEFGWSRSFLSTLYGAATLISALTVLVVGRITDRYGVRFTLAGAAVLFGIGLLTLSVAQSVLMVLVGFTLIRSFGSGSLPLVARAAIPRWFVSKRGLAFSLAGIGGTLGLAIVPPTSAILIDRLGWRVAWRVDAAVVLLTLVPLVLLLVRDRPEVVGQQADGGRSENPDSRGRRRVVPADTERTLREAVRTRAFWTLIWLGMVPATGLTAMSFHQFSIFKEAGIPTSVVAATFAIEAALTVPASFASGWLSDRTTFRVPMTMSAVLLLGASIAIAVAASAPIVVLYAALRGASIGLFGVAYDVAWPSYFGRERLGQIRGITAAAATVGAALAPIPVGVLYDRTGSYSLALAAVAVLPVTSVVAALLTTRPADPPAPA
jgi:MFS family permease